MKTTLKLSITTTVVFIAFVICNSLSAQSSTGTANKLKVDAEKRATAKGITGDVHFKACQSGRFVTHMLTSADPLFLSDVGSEKNIGVVAYQPAIGPQTMFDVTVQRSADGTNSFDYFIYQDGGTVPLAALKVGFPPDPISPCAIIEAQNAVILAAAQAQANATCSKSYTCIPICIGGVVVGYTMYVLSPASPPCPVVADPFNEDFTPLSALTQVVTFYTGNFVPK